jgi:hypothetical protein
MLLSPPETRPQSCLWSCPDQLAVVQLTQLGLVLSYLSPPSAAPISRLASCTPSNLLPLLACYWARTMLACGWPALW